MNEYGWLDIDTLKTVSQILAFLAGAGFFGYKLFCGYFFVNAGISARLERSTSTGADDYLTVSATMKKGSQGSLEIHDARARFTWSANSKEVKLVGFDRLAHRTDDEDPKRQRVVFGQTSKSAPFLNLTTEEEATFSAMVQIPHGEPCTVEVVILGIRTGGNRVAQWRTSVISIPNEEGTKRDDN